MDKADLAACCGLIVATPGGGRHLYFKRTVGVAVRTAAGDLAPNIDTRGHDARGNATGYIVGAGCSVPDGRDYRVVSGTVAALLEGELPAAPAKLLYPVGFSARERKIIAGEPELSTAIMARSPIAWRPTFEAHQVMHRPARARLEPVGADQMRRYATAALRAEAEVLEALADGRRDAVFRSACRMAKFATHAVLSSSEITDALLVAWDANGGTVKHGRPFAMGAIKRGLAMGKDDALPLLDAARHHRHTIGREDCL